MGPILLLELGILIVIAQAWASPSEPPKCVPGFKKDWNIFKVGGGHLHRGRVLGKVDFDDCIGHTRFEFISSNSHFQVSPDGTLKVTNETTLHGRQRDFVISALNSKGHTFTTTIRVVNEHHHHGKHSHSHEKLPNKIQSHHNPGIQDQHKSAIVYSFNTTEVMPIPDLPVLRFPKYRSLSKRQKRAWVIPPLRFPENDRGPFPSALVQIRSDADKEVKIQYMITGPGADQPPVGLFTVDRNSGQLYVTQPLDREKQDKYVLKAHADAFGTGQAEEAMEIIIYVIDQNDNRPFFTKEPFIGEVSEDSTKGTEVLQVNATDLDEPKNENSDLRYKIVGQEPTLPSKDLFAINPISGMIRLNVDRLDREKYPKYTLTVEAADRAGEGMTTTGHVILTVTDSNDNAPAFEMSQYAASVPENKVGALVVKMSVTDADEAHSSAWNAKFTIVGGDSEGRFAVETGPSKQEGIIKTVKGLDYETIKTYTLLVIAENEIPFSGRLPTATATVVVSVEDVNEAPVFSPLVKLVTRKEDLLVGSELVQYTATDPDTARSQKVSYKVMKDPARWLSVHKDTGLIKVKNTLDRESQYVKDNKYTALIVAYDDDDVPATGTGTLEIKLEDVNDNSPIITERSIMVCNKESAPQLLSVTDADGPDFGAPYTVSLLGMSSKNWTAKMNDTKTGIILKLVMPISSGDYNVVLRVADNHGQELDNIVQAKVCECTGVDVVCKGGRAAAIGLPVILGVLGAILLLLLLVLLLLMFLRRRGGEKKEPLLPNDDIRDNIYYYDEEGGGEDDQDYYDLSVLHRGLDNRPDVFRNDVLPNCGQTMPAVQYRPRPANPEDIGNFIDDNLKAADNDPLAPPYDSLLVFDDEGKGSDAGTLSSLNSSSSGDQDYDCLGEWGPRFKKLADMYGGGEDDML